MAGIRLPIGKAMGKASVGGKISSLTTKKMSKLVVQKPKSAGRK